MEETVIDKAIELGSTFFRNENFKKAKEVFRKALDLARSYDESELIMLREKHGLSKYCIPNPDKNSKVYHPRYLRLLDNISATYEKLGDLKKALKCAEKMTSVDPYSLKCYIRLGKILQKQGNDKEAYAAYVLGLEKAKEVRETHSWVISQKLIEIAQQQKSIVKERLKDQVKVEVGSSSARTLKRQYINPIKEHSEISKRARKCQPVSENELKERKIDFVCCLPVELLPLVFDGFTAKDLLGVMFVCKSWRARLKAFPQLFQRFILRSRTYRQLVKCCDFILYLYPLLDDVSQSRSLELLQFSSKSSHEELKSVKVLFSNLQNFQLRKLILAIPNCTTAHLAKYMASDSSLCKSLEYLSLILSFRADKPFEIEMLSHCENLRRLEVLVDCSVFPVEGRISRTSSFIEPKMVPTWAENLESFSLTCDQGRVKGFPFMTLMTHFPANHLSKLCITGVTFSSGNNQFDWLANFKYLKEIWFENNKSAHLAAFMHLLRDYPLSSGLQKVTFREDSIVAKVDLEEPSENYFYQHNLQNMREIDLMGSSISGLGITRLLSYMQPNKIKSFNIGDCPFIKIQRTPTLMDSYAFSPYHFLISVPHLENLLIPQLGALNDDTMKLLTEEVGNMENLRKLDLSLNPSITGVSLYEFLRALQETRSTALEYLNIDGCPSISHITVNMIRAQGLVRKIDCVYERESWRRFGVNSLKYQS